MARRTAELVTAQTAGAVVAELGLVPDPGAVQARALSGGISNIVLALEWEGGRAVLKQSLPKLRVATEWAFDRSRIVNERRCMELLGELLEPGLVAGDEHEVVAAGGELAGEGGADAGGRAGDESGGHGPDASPTWAPRDRHGPPA